MFTIELEGENSYIEYSNAKIQQDENKADILTFTIYKSSKYFSKLKKYSSKIIVSNEEDSTVIFEGRVIECVPTMDNSGIFSEEITCASSLDLLSDARVGKWDIHPDKYQNIEDEESNDPFVVYSNMTVKKYLKLILDTYNTKVLEDKQILLGDVVGFETDTVYCQNNRESCLNAIYEKLINRKGGYINLRKVNGRYYLDYYKELSLEENIIEVAVNMSSVAQKNTLTKYITRVIPIGADGITIASINNNIEYLEDVELIAKYGVIEEVVEFQDVTIKENLLLKARNFLKEYNNNIISIECGAIDLSYLKGDFNNFKISQYCNIKNKLLNVDTKQRIISKSIPLECPWNVTLGFGNNAVTVSGNTTNLTQFSNNVKLEMVVLGDKIISKVGKGELSTIVTQSAEEWGLSINGKLSGMTYVFDGESFKIGGTLSTDVATHTNSYSEWKFEDGSVARVDKNGFYNKIGSTKNEYHHLNYVYEGSISATLSNTGIFTLSITLPSEFKGKDFKATPVISDATNGVSNPWLSRVGIWITGYDKAKGIVNVKGQVLAFNFKSRNGITNNSEFFYYHDDENNFCALTIYYSVHVIA